MHCYTMLLSNEPIIAYQNCALNLCGSGNSENSESLVCVQNLDGHGARMFLMQ